jgi:pimeloyl-ACP methyl ester carboxylesterase
MSIILKSLTEQQRPLKSPLATILALPKEEQDKLDYRPDEFPGARDIPTPYGSIRTYEFGPGTGPKVLLIHGISTTCQSLSHIAHSAARRGYRVLLFDLFGRGFSDSPPDLPHDARLYVSQILLVLASSPIFSKGDKMRVVGYSLGGGIAVNFCATFPALVESCMLLAPAGFVERASYGAAKNVMLGSALVPEWAVQKLARGTLVKGLKPKEDKGAVKGKEVDEEEEDASLLEKLLAGEPGAGLGEAEVGYRKVAAGDQSLGARSHRYKAWMTNHHPGFLPAYLSCCRVAPISDQDDAYWQLGETEVPTGVVFARKDDKIFERDYFVKALPLLQGKEKRVFWKVVNGDHHFVMTHPSQVVGAIFEFWKEVDIYR